MSVPFPVAPPISSSPRPRPAGPSPVHRLPAIHDTTTVSRMDSCSSHVTAADTCDLLSVRLSRAFGSCSPALRLATPSSLQHPRRSLRLSPMDDKSAIPFLPAIQPAAEQPTETSSAAEDVVRRLHFCSHVPPRLAPDADLPASLRRFPPLFVPLQKPILAPAPGPESIMGPPQGRSTRSKTRAAQVRVPALWLLPTQPLTPPIASSCSMAQTLLSARPSLTRVSPLLCSRSRHPLSKDRARRLGPTTRRTAWIPRRRSPSTATSQATTTRWTASSATLVESLASTEARCP